MPTRSAAGPRQAHRAATNQDDGTATVPKEDPVSSSATPGETKTRETRVPTARKGTPGERKRPRRPSDRLVSGECRLGSYRDGHGREREIVCVGGPTGARLVLDRDAHGAGEVFLLARLHPDEPAANARLLCGLYLQDPSRQGRCRAVRAADLDPADDDSACKPGTPGSQGAPEPAAVDPLGRAYTLGAVDSGLTIPELRWQRAGSAPRTISLRDAVGALESYEPLLSITRRALGGCGEGGAISTVVLRAELARVEASPIVLNRALRAAVTGAVQRGEASMSEIAMRCGRIKRDRRGNESGETSWLARRLGLLPEGGHTEPTPWIHSDVLGLIARRGLGVSPREVEL